MRKAIFAVAMASGALAPGAALADAREEVVSGLTEKDKIKVPKAVAPSNA